MLLAATCVCFAATDQTVQQHSRPPSPSTADDHPGSDFLQNVHDGSVRLQVRSHHSEDDPDQRYLQQVKSSSPHLEPLHLVLLFPRGEKGWEHSIPHASAHRPGPEGHAEEGDDGDAEGPCDPDGSHLTTIRREYCAYRLMQHRSADNVILLAGLLGHEWEVTQWAMLENERLQYIRYNQAPLRADVYRVSLIAEREYPHLLHCGTSQQFC